MQAGSSYHAQIRNGGTVKLSILGLIVPCEGRLGVWWKRRCYILAVTNGTDLETLMSAIDSTTQALNRDLCVIADTLPEMRRQARAGPKRRSRDAARYTLGGTLTVLGFEHIDPMALTGLFGKPVQMSMWLADVGLVECNNTLAELVEKVFLDDAKFEWCRQWGVHVQWHHGKTLYDAAVTSFIASGRTGPRERWRRDEITADQAHLIQRICIWRRLGEPALQTRGEAFDWIFEAGGNPTWWAPPSTPSDWG